MENTKELLSKMKSGHSGSVKAACWERLKESNIPPDEQMKAEILSFSAIGKDLARNLRAVKRLGGECRGLYFQLNPAARWSVNIGVLPVRLNASNLTQEQLFYTQEETFSCKGNDEAAGLYFRTRNMPCADAVADYLWVCTLMEICGAATAINPDMEIYIGVAHSDIWAKV